MFFLSCSYRSHALTEPVPSQVSVQSESPAVLKSRLRQEDREICISLAVNKDIPAGAQIGILCRDERGNNIFTTNLVNFNSLLPELKSGTNGTVEWEFTMPVYGTFFFSMGIKPDKMSSDFYDRPFNIASLKTVKRDPEDITCALFSIEPENISFKIG